LSSAVEIPDGGTLHVIYIWGKVKQMQNEVIPFDLAPREIKNTIIAAVADLFFLLVPHVRWLQIT